MSLLIFQCGSRSSSETTYCTYVTPPTSPISGCILKLETERSILLEKTTSELVGTLIEIESSVADTAEDGTPTSTKVSAAWTPLTFPKKWIGSSSCNVEFEPEKLTVVCAFTTPVNSKVIELPVCGAPIRKRPAP